MKTKKIKETVDTLEVMIRNADKGPSGFWVDDHDGCGNPYIFPEFAEGLKKGSLVQKAHYLCPWNTAVLFGKGHGNLHTGCYHSCSISQAKYLPPSMLKDILIRFKSCLLSGKYDCTKNLEPLLTASEIDLIEKEKKLQLQSEKENRQLQRKLRLEHASALIQKHPEYKELFAVYYGEKVMVQTEDGSIDFNPQGYRDIVGAENFTYDEYIDVQIRSFHNIRGWFATCYHNTPLSFKGCIERKNKANICFKRITVDGMYPDGVCFEGKEDHVWMHISGFEKFEIGDCVCFFADVYRYVKTGNGKQIDYSLRNPQGIQKVKAYALPTDGDLMKQTIAEILCESCYLNDHCNRGHCIRSPKEIKQIKKDMHRMMQEGEKK